MKTLIIITTSLLFFCLGFYADYKFVHYCLNQLPNSLSEYLGIIKIALYFFTFGITLSLSIAMGAIGLQLSSYLLEK